MEDWKYSSTHFTLGTRRMQVSDQLHAPTLLFQGKYPSVPIRHTGVYVAPRNVLQTFESRLYLPRRTSKCSYLKKIKTLSMETIFLLIPKCQHGLFFGGEGRGREGADD